MSAEKLSKQHPNLYLKATRAGGVSGYDPLFIHRIGLNVCPDYSINNSTCGKGIHLAKNLKAAKKYCPNAEEFYLARLTPSSKILGEDDEKIRVDEYECIRLLKTEELAGIDARLKIRLPRPPSLCGDNWLAKHAYDISQEEIDNQALVIGTRAPILAKFKTRERRYLIKSFVGAGR